MIVQSAKVSGCTTLYSEDLNAGQSFGGVRIVNPFVGLAPWAVHEPAPT
jgi:predicted nucleic acid-binding protein